MSIRSGVIDCAAYALHNCKVVVRVVVSILVNKTLDVTQQCNGMMNDMPTVVV